ncbi:phage tail protein [Tistrella mobilis]|uniref:phage tail protein n=1 Tax=Tistrella mobilis TaxID=171437 RepID=UPI0035573E36
MDPFIGEIRIFPFGFAPSGWMPCEGQELQVSQNQALAALLGNTYGGNWPTTFKLPDLRGRAPLGQGQHNGFSYSMGNAIGSQTVTLTVGQLPQHTHTMSALSTEGNLTVPTASNGLTAMLANTGDSGSQPNGPEIYIAPPPTATLTPLRPETVTSTGGGQAHPNEQPSLAVYYCIATTGLWPPRS